MNIKISALNGIDSNIDVASGDKGYERFDQLRQQSSVGLRILDDDPSQFLHPERKGSARLIQMRQSRGIVEANQKCLSQMVFICHRNF